MSPEPSTDHASVFEQFAERQADGGGYLPDRPHLRHLA